MRGTIIVGRCLMEGTPAFSEEHRKYTTIQKTQQSNNSKHDIYRKTGMKTIEQSICSFFTSS